MRFKRFLINVDTNPKHLIALLNMFRSIKRLEPKSDEAWKTLEDLVSIALAVLYGGEPFTYGYKKLGENVPDSIFFVRDDEGHFKVIGLVDVKSGKRMKVTVSDAKKYLAYFRSMDKIKWITQAIKVVLYFITLEDCGRIKLRWDKEELNKGLKGFYYAILNGLKTNEYIVIMPLSSLIMVVDTYLSVIRRLRIGLSREGYGVFLEVIDPKVDSKVMCRFADKLYCLDSRKLERYFEEKIKNLYVREVTI